MIHRGPLLRTAEIHRGPPEKYGGGGASRPPKTHGGFQELLRYIRGFENSRDISGTSRDT